MLARHPAWLIATLTLTSTLLAANGCTLYSDDPALPEVDAGPSGNDAQPGCPEADALWDDVDLATFQPIPELADLDFSAITPAEPPTSWELRFDGIGDSYEVIATVGEPCAEASDDAACMHAFQSLSTDTGFAPGCLPAYCYYYAAVNRGDDNALITQGSALIDFLGTIDNPTEAVLAAFAEGYDWNPSDLSVAGVRPVPGGFELLVQDLVRGCDPIQTDRFLLFVSTSGAVEVRRQQIYSILCGACI